MILTTFDPGFDSTGWAVFDLPTIPRTINGIIRCLVTAGQIETSPSKPDTWRMGHLGSQIHVLLIGHPPDVVGIEMPAYAGDYGNNRGRRSSVNKLYMAIGAIMSRMANTRVHEIRALTAAKEVRHQLLMDVAEKEGVELPTGPRGGKHEDAWDAIFLGIQLVMDQGASLFAPRNRNHEPLNERAVG